MTRVKFAVLTLAAVGALFMMMGASPAVHASDRSELIVALPEQATVPVPAPGHEEVTEMTVNSTHGAPVEVSLRIDAEGQNLLVAPDSALRVTIEVNGASLGPGMPVASLVQHPITLGSLEPGERCRVRVVVALDPAAGNEYAGMSAEARFRFSAQAEDGPTGPLATTGSSLPLVLLIVAGMSVVIGAGLFAARRRRQSQEGSE